MKKKKKEQQFGQLHYQVMNNPETEQRLPAFEVSLHHASLPLFSDRALPQQLHSITLSLSPSLKTEERFSGRDVLTKADSLINRKEEYKQ